MSTLGLGAYEGCNLDPSPVRAWPGLRLMLAHRCPRAAVLARDLYPECYVIWRWDEGDDDRQFDWGSSLDAAVSKYRADVGRGLAGLGRPYRSVVDALTGPNERWPGSGDERGLNWRAALEARLCRVAQAELGLDYVALSCPVGNLEVADVGRFTDVLRAARWVGYHGYLGPGRKSLAEEADAWYLWRPLELWLPEMRRLGLELRLLLTETGPYHDWRQMSLNAEEAAALCGAIDREMAARARRLGVRYGGALPFGWGVVDKMEPWELRHATVAMVKENGTAPVPKPAPAPSPPAEPRLWLAVIGSNQDRNRTITGSTEMAHVALLAARVLAVSRQYPALKVKVFAGPPESRDTTNLAGLRDQQARARAWLDSAPPGALTVAANLHSDAGSYSHLGYYYRADPPAFVSKRLAEALARGLLAFWPAGTRVLSADYSDYLFARLIGRHCPVLLEIGSHEVAADVATVRDRGYLVARRIVESCLSFFGLPAKPA